MTFLRHLAIRFFYIFLICIPFTSVSLSAELDEGLPAVPALLDETSRSLQNRIQFPNISEDVFVLVLCNTIISRDGDFNDRVYCYREKELEDSIKPAAVRSVQRSIEVGPDVEVTEVVGRSFDWYEERFERQVVEAARISRIQPARLNGRRVKVKMNFSVLFRQENGEKSIEVFQHHFRNVAAYGTEYIAAQRFYEQKRFWESAEPNECPVTHIPIWIRSIVMTNGSAYNVYKDDMTDTNGASDESMERCVTAYMAKIKNNLMVPVIAQGRYVNGRYVELFYEDPREENAELDESVLNSVVNDFKGDSGCLGSPGKETFGDRWRGAESALCRE